MQINQWQGGALHITRENDEFYDRPLPELTLFRFSSDNVEVEPHAGSFSIKFVRSGRERYEFSHRSSTISPREALLINAGEIYASEIKVPSESISLFYLEEEVKDAYWALSTKSTALLNNPNGEKGVDVAQVPMRMEDELHLGLSRLVASTDSRDTLDVEHAARAILANALAQSLVLTPPTALPNITKRATRDELISRVDRAKRYIDDMNGRKCTLPKLADIACLSKYHFLRVFREAFGVTPLSYARRRRLEIAQHALRKGASLSEAARCSEYSDQQAFERAYWRTFGHSPRRCRQN